LIPLIARPVVQAAAAAVFGAQAALTIGSFLAVLILFSVPVTLLGCVSPFAIRLAVATVETAGKSVGLIFALSTLGSLLGTFLPVLILIPAVGTFRTFLIFAALLYGVALVGLWREIGTRALRLLWMALVVVALALVVFSGPLRAAASGATLLYEAESAYNYIQVQEDAAGYRYLYLNEGQGIHSQWHPDIVTYERTWSFFLTAPYFNAPPFQADSVESLSIIGLAAGTIARQYSQVYGPIPIDGIEIDPGIITAGERYFGMSQSEMPNLTVYAQDGRFILNQLLDKRYSLVAIDAYRPPYIPWHLTTREYFEEVVAHLTDDGVVAINVGRTETDRRLVDAMTSTLLAVFPSVHAMDVPLSFNTILVATRMPSQASNLAANLALMDDSANPLLREALRLGVQQLADVHPGDTVFTDDHAPVEALVDSIVIDFLFSGGVEQLSTAE
jgi:spermidine synthase